MNMIERVARAIYEGRNGSGCKPWSRLTQAHRDPYIADASAAIKAMRDPTDAMIDAVRPQHYAVEHYDGSGHHRKFPTLGSGNAQMWADMIDVALAGSDGGKQQTYVDESWSW